MRALIVRVGLLLTTAVFLLSHPRYAEPMYMGLGDLPGGGFWSSAHGVSAGGSTVVRSGDITWNIRDDSMSPEQSSRFANESIKNIRSAGGGTNR